MECSILGKILKRAQRRKPKKKPAHVQEIASRLNKYLPKLNGMSETDFLLKLGLAHTNSTQWFRQDGCNSPPNAESLIAMGRAFGININWLLLGEGKMFLPGRTPRKKPPI